MNVFLMHESEDFVTERQPPRSEPALTRDLALDTLFGAMAPGDEFILDVVKKAVLCGLTDPASILYRQAVLRDCLENEQVVRAMYDIALEAIEGRKRSYWSIFTRHPGGILYRAVDLLQMFALILKKLRALTDEHAGQFRSEGFQRFFAMVREELGDEYFDEIEEHLIELKFRGGVLISAGLGEENRGTGYLLHRPDHRRLGWIRRWIDRIFRKNPSVYSFRLHPRDENGARALSELKDRGLNLVANALAQSTDHILGFFRVLRTELAFYIGCLNLHDRLVQKGDPSCFPAPLPFGDRRLSFTGLYDVCLLLGSGRKIVGNDVDAHGKTLVIVTGANQGGKSTFLRSVGLAQLMMQAGMFVPAESFSSEVCDALFTHFKREEDASMKSGKLDEELCRMNDVVNGVTPNSIFLFNESFAATNEREGSEIAGQIASALTEKGVRVFFVTHLYEFASAFYSSEMKNALFLRAEREGGGERTFRLVEGEPLQTSYGEDLYEKVFNRRTTSPVRAELL